MISIYRVSKKISSLNEKRYPELNKRKNVIVLIANNYMKELQKIKYSSDVDFTGSLEKAEKEIIFQLNRITTGLNHIISKKNKNKIKQEILNKWKKPIENSVKLIDHLELEHDAYKKAVMETKLIKLKSIYSSKLTTLFAQKVIRQDITNLNGKVMVPAKAKLVLIQASRLSKEEYTWLVPVNEKSGTQILTNQNVTTDNTSIGTWIFDNF